MKRHNKFSAPRKEEQRKSNANVIQSVQGPSQVVNQSGQRHPVVLALHSQRIHEERGPGASRHGFRELLSPGQEMCGRRVPAWRS